MKEKARNLFYKIWYWYISTIDKDAEVVFMNFGFSNNNEKMELKKEDEKNRYSAQLYNLIATGVDIEGKNILEVGCGRGGGISFLNRYFLPNSVTGVDLNKKAIKFCKKHYPEKSNTFLQANAQSLPFSDNSYDVVINIESSHRYPQPELFFSEVFRVLNPGGYFLFADFRNDKEIDRLESQLKNTKFQVEKKQDITSHVVEALKLVTPDREILINKILPGFLQSLGKTFAATEGSSTYNKFTKREFEYVFYVLMK
ncbi:MAG: class I SAM-dependent methyltransferase [Bacteroidetes bacterium]|nr:MAG: class I SAM-dependent methyltransferase [Bacteroidota bacterium]